MKLPDFQTLLERCGLPAYYREAPADEAGDYIVYHEYRRNDEWADGVPLIKIWRVQADMYTRVPFDPRAERLEAALTAASVPFSVITDYSRESGVYRYTYQCDVVVDSGVPERKPRARRKKEAEV